MTAAQAARPSPASPGSGALRGGSAPLPLSAEGLLARSDAELLAAQLAGDPGDRLVHAHLAALRAGAALLEVSGRPTRRPAPRTVWDMVQAVAPQLADWTAYFAATAPVRAAVESGRAADLDESRADRTVAAAEDFHQAVRELLGLADAHGQRVLALRAS